MRARAAYHRAGGGYGQAQDGIAARSGVRIGRAQLAGLAQDMAGWVDDFYDQRAQGADAGLPASDVIMMQAGGKGIAVLPGHPAAKGSDAAHPGIKKIAGFLAAAHLTPPLPHPGATPPPPA